MEASNCKPMKFSIGQWNIGKSAQGAYNRNENRTNITKNTLKLLSQSGKLPDIILAQEVESEKSLKDAFDIYQNKPGIKQKPERVRYSDFGLIIATEQTPNFNTDIIEAYADDRITKVFRNKKILTRMQVGILRLGKVRSRPKCLLVSWHGPNKEPGTDRDKSEFLKQALLDMEELRKYEKCDLCIISGDFNLSAAKTCEQVLSDSKIDRLSITLYSQEKSTKRPIPKDCIDYLMSWGDGKFEFAIHSNAGKVIEPDEHPALAGQAFDHDLIVYECEIKLRKKGLKLNLGDVHACSILLAQWDVSPACILPAAQEMITELLPCQLSTPDIQLFQGVGSPEVYDRLSQSYRRKFGFKEPGNEMKHKPTAVFVIERDDRDKIRLIRYTNTVDNKHMNMCATVIELGHGRPKLCLVVSLQLDQDAKLSNIIETVDDLKQKTNCDMCIMGGNFDFDIGNAKQITDIDVHGYEHTSCTNYLITWPKGVIVSTKADIVDQALVEILQQYNSDVTLHMELFFHPMIWYKLQIDFCKLHRPRGTSGSNSA